MIKSQDDLNTCNDGHRSSDVLVATIEKCERLDKLLKRAVDELVAFQNHKSVYSTLLEIKYEYAKIKQIEELDK